MSAHGHATPGDAAASHDDHHYLGIPADRPGPDEPRTPLYLPLVGIALLLAALLAFVMTRPPGKTGAELAAEAVPSGAVAAAPAPAPSASVNPRMRRLPPGIASMFPPGTMPPGAAPGGAAPRPAMPVQARPAPGAAAPNPGAAVPRPRPAPPPGH